MIAAAAHHFATIAHHWRPRDAVWFARELSRFASHSARPLLIGSCPRSGSTLLRSLLDNHPHLAVPRETDFVFFLLRYRAGFGDLREERNRRRIAQWLFVNSEGRGGDRIRASADRDEAIERVAAAGPTLGSVIAACFELYAERQGAVRWGDKRPAYAGWLPWMFELFPDAQFVNLVRDPRSAVASQLPLGFDEENVALAASVANWETSIARVDACAERLAPDQLLDVRYEDLVRDPRGTLRGIVAWAGLDASDETIEQMIASERGQRLSADFHSRVKEEIDPARVDAWRERLEPEQVAFIEEATRPYLDRFGYLPLPDLDAAPDPAERARLRRQRIIRKWRWTRRGIEDRVNRLRTRNRPLAAEPHPWTALPAAGGTQDVGDLRLER